MPDPDEVYDIEPPDEPSPPASPPSGSGSATSGTPASPASAESPLRDRSVHGLDVCPNCGSPMRGTDTLVCLRCGYDLKTMQVVKTKTGVVEKDDDAAPPVALVRPGGPGWLPGAMLAVGLLVLVVATLAGWRGLFPEVAAEADITFPTRLLGLARLPVRLAVWTLCVVAGLGAISWRAERPFGDLPLALGRAAGIAAVAMIVTLLRVPWRFGEIALECAGATGVALLLVSVLFRLKPRDAGQAVLFALGTFVVIAAGAYLVVWAA